MSFRTLKPDKIIETLEALRGRIEGRFPGSGLARVCGDVIMVARQTCDRIEGVFRPHWGLRILLAFILASLLALIIVLGLKAQSFRASDELSDLMQGVDAAVSLTIVLGGAAIFLATVESRWKRDKALKALHELRSIVHVIDMHQLTKDPSMLGQARTSSSPMRNMTPFELMRYLDYCSEMLSLTAKCAALYAEKVSDPVVVDTVGDIERLTSDLSGKIWQKITIVQSLESRDVPLPVPQPFYRPGA